MAAAAPESPSRWPWPQPAPPGTMTRGIKPSNLVQLDAYLAAQKGCQAQGWIAQLMREDEQAKSWTVTYGCV